MGIFEIVSSMGHEQVVFCSDQESGLRAIVAIHDTSIGPALGGCRFWDYKNEEDAIIDVLRLSKGMTYKAAVTGLPLGGGKAVIIGNPQKLKSEKLFRAFGRFVDGLNGRYITAEDVNVRPEDINHVAKETKYVSGISQTEHGSGDPSPITALGVFSGLKAAVHYKLKTDSLKGVRVAVQGVGAVGRSLAQQLFEAGAELTIADIDLEATKRVAEKCNAKIMDPFEIHGADVDVFAPCALGGGLNDHTIPAIRAKIIAGAANNQLLEEKKHGEMLMSRGILYAPDYAINAGGLINVCHELMGYNKDKAISQTLGIYNTLLSVFESSEREKIPTWEATNKIAESRIEAARKTTPRLSNTFNNQSWIQRS